METMQWSEISTSSSSQTSAGVVNGVGGNDQRQHHNSHGPGAAGSENGLGGGSLGAPTIKNHSVTYFNDHLYCFGGYDGRRNHNLLLLYNIKEHRWIRPQAVQDDDFNNNNSSRNNNVVSDSSDASTTRVNHQRSTSISTSSNNNNNSRRRETDFEVDDSDETTANDTGNEDGEDNNSGGNNQNGSTSNDDSNNDSAPEQINQSQEIQNRQQALIQQHAVAFNNNPYDRNNSNNNHDGFYPGIGGGGHDRSRHNNNNNASTYAYTVTGNPPPGRNGHSATLATDEDDDNDEDDEQRGDDITGRIIVLGGWLGQGPLAASDMHVLDISRGGKALRWYQPAVKGTPPGPCNMHSADYVKARKEVFVFRGGNGREYLNDVHALHVPTMTWRKVTTTGESPQQRANHSSCILEETGEIFIFGGWNGTTRLNDIHIFDTKTCNWTCPKVGGVLPHPRAGMTLTALRGRLYLFGGSGTSSKCFQDLQILDREEMSWLDVTQYETVPHGNVNNGGSNSHHHNQQMHHPNYHRQNHFAQPPPSQHYYIHSHQHQHYQQQHQHNQQFANHQENGFVPPNPQWNGGGQSYHDYGHQSRHQYHHPNDSSNNRSNFGGNGAYIGTGMVCSYQQQHGNNSNNTPMNSHPRSGTFTSSRADWISREMAAQPRSMGTGVIASPNPNDEDTAPTILLHGHRVPGSRAGHTATAVNRKIYVFGGSCGSDYLNDFYVLDTDPPPRASVSEATSSHLIERRLWYFFNDEEFSDVTFLVQGRRVYGHKMVLALVSDCFRAMFTAGFRESSSSEIEITGCTYEAFLAVLEYIYTGAEPSMTIPSSSPMSDNYEGDGSSSARYLGKIVDILELADRFFLDHLKQVCETQLQLNVRADTVEYLLQVSQKTNAIQLQAICEHYTRNRDSE